MAKISHIKHSDVLEARRYDAEYFKPEHLEINNELSSSGALKLSEFSNLHDGPFGSDLHSNEYTADGVPVLRMQNITNSGDVNLENLEHISEDSADRLIKHIAYPGEVVTTKIGFLGYTTVLPNTYKRYFFRREITRVAIKNKKINPYYLSVFLNSKYGRSQVRRLSSGATRDRVLLVNQKNILVPIANDSFQLQIEQIVKSAHQKRTESGRLYNEAEELLLKELGLLDFEVKHSLSFTTTKSEISEAQRYDSEYFQPKYDEIIKKIEGYDGGWDFVRNQFRQNTTLSKKDGEYCNYIEISDIDISSGEITPTRLGIKDIPANGKRKLFTNDLLISKVRPYRGAVSFIDFEVDNLIGSGAFTVLQEKTDYRKEVLMIFLKTQFIKEFLLRYNCGTTYPVIKDEDILDLKIPLIKPPVQKQIAEKIQESHRLRKVSKELLEDAKRKVEEEIEK